MALGKRPLILFTIYWAKEYSNVFISAAVEGTDGYHLDNIKVACKPCTIEPSLSMITPGQELVCSTLYKFENKGRIKPEWYFDNTSSKKFDRQILKHLQVYT